MPKQVINPPHCSDQISIAIEQSVKEHEEKSSKMILHKRRVDRILRANGMTRIPIPPDGDCFFTILSNHLRMPVIMVRSQIVDHLLTYWSFYAPFFSGPKEKFVQAVLDIGKRGAWNDQCMDFVPQAASDLFVCEIVLICSGERPILTNRPKVSTKNKIWMAYLEVPENEHFDAVGRA